MQSKLLIEPEGIETSDEMLTKLAKTLLIEPEGIETAHAAVSLILLFWLLIEPEGIETPSLEVWNTGATTIN